MLVKIGVAKVFLAGFDGYLSGNDYYDHTYVFAGNEKYLIESNDTMKMNLQKISKYISIQFITRSLYQEDTFNDC